MESTPDKSKRIICFCLGDRAYSAATRLNWRSDTIIASRPICDMAPQIGFNPGILTLPCAALLKTSIQSPHIILLSSFCIVICYNLAMTLQADLGNLAKKGPLGKALRIVKKILISFSGRFSLGIISLIYRLMWCFIFSRFFNFSFDL